MQVSQSRKPLRNEANRALGEALANLLLQKSQAPFGSPVNTRCCFCGSQKKPKKVRGRKPDPLTGRIIDLKKSNSYKSVALILQAELKAKSIAKAVEEGFSQEEAEQQANKRFDESAFQTFLKKVKDAVQKHNKNKRAAKVAEKLAAENLVLRKLGTSNLRRRRPADPMSNMESCGERKILDREVKKENVTKISKSYRTRRRNRPGSGDVG